MWAKSVKTPFHLKAAYRALRGQFKNRANFLTNVSQKSNSISLTIRKAMRIHFRGSCSPGRPSGRGTDGEAQPYFSENFKKTPLSDEVEEILQKNVSRDFSWNIPNFSSESVYMHTEVPRKIYTLPQKFFSHMR